MPQKPITEPYALVCLAILESAADEAENHRAALLPCIAALVHYINANADCCMPDGPRATINEVLDIMLGAST